MILCRKPITWIALLLLLAACSTKPYKPAPFKVDTLRQRAEVQTFEPLTVKSAVPSAEESEALFGLALYEHDIQPVWLEITNRGDENIRFAMVGVDPDYYSPLEVAYTLRSGFSASARAAMDERFNEAGITRFIDPGETISGFVFTHLSPGTKSFNVDLFGLSTHQNFAFFIKVPGFTPDHAEVGFDDLYAQDQARDLSIDELRSAIAELRCCSSNETGDSQGLPLNVVIVGSGRDLIRALLRGDWYESSTGGASKGSQSHSPYYFFGRKPDRIFRIQRTNSVDRNELRAWLTPWRVNGEAVWLAQVTNFVGQRSHIGKLFFGAHLDPDVDDARSFLLQNIWYSQGLKTFAWSRAEAAIPFDQPRTDFNGNQWFTDGFRAVMWVSGTPNSLLETWRYDWDEVPVK